MGGKLAIREKMQCMHAQTVTTIHFCFVSWKVCVGGGGGGIVAPFTFYFQSTVC